MSSAVFPPLSELSYAVLLSSSRTSPVENSGKILAPVVLKAYTPCSCYTAHILVFASHFLSFCLTFCLIFSHSVCVCVWVHVHIPFNKITCFSYKSNDNKNHLKNKCLYLPCAFCLHSSMPGSAQEASFYHFCFYFEADRHSVWLSWLRKPIYLFGIICQNYSRSNWKPTRRGSYNK